MNGHSLSALLIFSSLLQFAVTDDTVAQTSRSRKTAPKQLPADVQAIADYVAAVEKSQRKETEDKLEVRVTYLPDPFAYTVAKRYLAKYEAIGAQREALLETKAELKKWKHKKKYVGVRVELENRQKSMQSSSYQRIYTFHDRIPGKFIQVTRDRKRKVKLTPFQTRNLRERKLRVKKFYVRQGDRRVPKLGPPIPSFVVEDRPAIITLGFPVSKLRNAQTLEIHVLGVKTYYGPFKNGEIDLNFRRTWDVIEPIEVDLDIPEAVPEIPAELQKVLDRVKKRK